MQYIKNAHLFRIKSRIGRWMWYALVFCVYGILQRLKQIFKDGIARAFLLILGWPGVITGNALLIAPYRKRQNGLDDKIAQRKSRKMCSSS
jgi:hypothetical protein